MKACILSLAGALIAGNLAAETVFYVDGTNGRDNYDGLAAQWDGTHGPKRVIQDAVDLFGPGGVGTIKVLPGVYGDDQGYTFATNKATGSAWGDGTVRCRVFVADKCLRIESTAGAEKTHIVGKWSATDSGLGADAIRCVGIGCGPHSVNTVIKGFTLRDGATRDVDNMNAADGNGGAVGTDRSTLQAYVVDCTVSNCVARRGGGLYQATAVRTQIIDNRVKGDAYGAAAYRANLYASAVYNNGAAISSKCEVIMDCPQVLNCAVFANNGGDLRVNLKDGNVVNTLFASPRLDYATRDDGSVALNVSHCAFNITAGREVLRNSGSGTSETIVNILSDPYVVVSPWESDFRPVKDGATDGTGLVIGTRPDWIPEEFWGTGLDGRPLVVNGKTPIGPVATAVEMKGGFLAFNEEGGNPLPTIEGTALNLKPPVWPTSSSYNKYYIGSETWPRQVRVTVHSADPTALAHHFGVGGIPGVSNAPGRWFGRDNSVALTFPPAGVAFAHTTAWATNVVYCAPNGLDTNDGLTEEMPKTINGACAAASDRTLVIALPGTYRGDPVTAGGMATRASVATGVFLRSRDGAAATVIEGVSPTTADGKLTYGDSAVRCLHLADGACAQGLTLTGGSVKENANTPAGSGGGLFGSGTRSVLMDSVVTNCFGSRGIVRYAWAIRCRIVDCRGQDQAMLRECNASSCEFLGNHLSAGNAMTVNSTAYGCSFYEPDYNNNCIIGGSNSMSAYNCIAAGSAIGFAPLGSDYEYLGCFTDKAGQTGVTSVSDPFFDPTHGDLRIRSSSAALYGGSAEAVKPARCSGGSNAKADWARFTTDDIEGNLVRFRDGKPTAGARQKAVQVVNVKAAKPGEVSPTGTFALDEGETLTVTVSDEPKRQYLGYEIDGVFTPTAARTFAVAPSAFPEGVMTARAVFNTNWYVNAEAAFAADTNDGWTPQTARKTLVKGVEDAVPGDVVHLAKGTYAEGDYLHDTALLGGVVHIKSRVYVPAGVTLAGDGGPEGVVITGLRASKGAGEDSDAIGNGSDAVRCVALAGGAKVMNVTLTDGHTGISGSSKTAGGIGQDDNYGGGVLGMGRNSCYVENCIITNCTGGRAAAVGGALAINCFISGNNSGGGAAGRNANFIGCVLSHNIGTQPVLEIGYIVDSTYVASGNNPAISSVGYIANSVIVSDREVKFGDAACALSNCVLNAEAQIANDKVTSNNLVRIAAADLKLDLATGKLQKDSPLVDWASGRFATAADAYLRPKDLYGVPRVLNGGKQDLGATEYDWRVDYGGDLCEGKVEVTDVSPFAKELANGRVSLPEGELILNWAAEKSRTILAEVTGNGVLELYREGASEPVHVWTNGSAARYKMREASSVPVSCRFVYTPGPADTGSAVFGPFSGTPGVVFVVR